MASKKDFTLVYQSRSNQFASPSQPRVILEKSNLILAFTAAPGKPGFDSLEILERNPQTKKLDLHLIRFGKDSPRFIDRPRNCMHCHAVKEGPDQPIWETGKGKWTGAYGSLNERDVLVQEQAMLQEFRRLAQSNPRYRELPALEEVFVEPPEGGGANYSSVGSVLFMPRRNFFLESKLSDWNAQQFARKITDLEGYGKIRADLLRFAHQGKPWLELNALLKTIGQEHVLEQFPGIESSKNARMHIISEINPEFLRMSYTQKKHYIENCEKLLMDAPHR